MEMLSLACFRVVPMLLSALTVLLCAMSTIAAPRLGIVPTDSGVQPISDLLTAELSSNPGVDLLERAEVQRIYREQVLAAAGQDVLQLGELLGADGLLLLSTVHEGTNRFVSVRLVAVKPGAVLLVQRFPVSKADPGGWAAGFSKVLTPWLPKLAVAKQEAIPVSILNFRSTIQSSRGMAVERQLTSLAVQRLSFEERLFVLERERLNLLSVEKDFQRDASGFWNGAYLLDGVIDPEGFSEQTIRLSARLVPPGGGAPVQIAASGARTNLAAVVNDLAEQIIEKLNLGKGATPWTAADEAARFVNEAEWALRWDLFAQAQAAAESAWALGRKDTASAVVRVQSYAAQLPVITASNVSWYIPRRAVRYLRLTEPPDPRDCEIALQALRAYEEFCRLSPEAEPAVGPTRPGRNDLRSFDWYRTGVQALASASSVLQHFYHHPHTHTEARDVLQELRSMCRTVAQIIASAPSVRDSYFVGERLATGDELNRTIHEEPNIFRCKLLWGAFWQERPEDCIQVYRELMQSPVFAYLHAKFWYREPHGPRVVAWNPADRHRADRVWRSFVTELEESTNAFWQLEAKALAFADAVDETALARAFTNFFEAVYANRDVLVTNPVDVMNSNWGIDALMSGRTGSGIVTPVKEALARAFYSEHRGKLMAMRDEYFHKTIPAWITVQAVAKQKEYLARSAAYNAQEFMQIFRERNYTKAQAQELLPLVATYKSNLLAHAPPSERVRTENHVASITRSLERRLNAALEENPAPIIAPAPQARVAAVPQPRPPSQAPPRRDISEPVTNPVVVRQFIPIPVDKLEGEETTHVTVTAHHWQDGKLVLDLAYTVSEFTYDARGNWKSTRYVSRSAVGILDLDTKQWIIASCPISDSNVQNRFYHRTAYLNGQLYMSDREHLMKYDFVRRRWDILGISDGGNYELFVVNNRLYAADTHAVLEIFDGGRSTRILASTRRHPPASVLDSEKLVRPILFAGPNESLRIRTAAKIFAWKGNDWEFLGSLPSSARQLEVVPEGLLWRTGSSGSPDVWLISNHAEEPDWLVGRAGGTARPGNPWLDSRRARWEPPPRLISFDTPAAISQSRLYFLVDESESQNIFGERKDVIIGTRILPRNGYHASLYCFSPGVAVPQRVFLKFEAGTARPPLLGANTTVPTLDRAAPVWMLFTKRFVVFGTEAPNPATGGSVSAHRHAMGVWVASAGEIETAREADEERRAAISAREETASEQARRQLFSSFDADGDGQLNPAERMRALRNQSFAAMVLGEVDLNGNRRLDPDELGYFDANGNRKLDPEEREGIDVAEMLFAAETLKLADVDYSGGLSPMEYHQWLSGAGSGGLGGFPDTNHSGDLDADELLPVLQRLLRVQLRSPLLAGAAAGPGRRAVVPAMLGRPSTLEAEVESYWAQQQDTDPDVK